MIVPIFLRKLSDHKNDHEKCSGVRVLDTSRLVVRNISNANAVSNAKNIAAENSAILALPKIILSNSFIITCF